MYRLEGIRGMFKGNGANCARIIPNSAVKFLCYEQFAQLIAQWYAVFPLPPPPCALPCALPFVLPFVIPFVPSFFSSRRRRRETGQSGLTPGLRLIAGAGIIAMSATYPLDMVRGRLTVQEGATKQQYSGMWHATRTIIRQEGALALYKGWLPSVIGVVPYVGLNFAVYESLKDLIIKSEQTTAQSERELSVVTRLGCGAVAGTIGQTVAYPFDVARRRLQVSGWKGADHLVVGEAERHIYRGMWDCFVKTVRYEGPSALFKGLWANYVKVVPSIAIAFVTYEQVKELMGVDVIISS